MWSAKKKSFNEKWKESFELHIMIQYYTMHWAKVIAFLMLSQYSNICSCYFQEMFLHIHMILLFTKDAAG